jgi:glucokinase
MAIVAGIDLGGTGCRVVIQSDGTIIARTTALTAQLGEGSEAARVSRLADAVLALLPAGGSLTRVGFGASGPVDCVQGIVRNPATLPTFSGFPLAADLSARLGVPVIMDNDAVVAAIGEYHVGAGNAARRMLMVTLGTGIGVAFLLDGAPFRGPGDLHPEAGHIPIVTSTVRCYCGAYGCWEQMASRAALQTMLRPLLPPDVEGHELIERAVNTREDSRIERAFDDYGRLVGRGLSALHALYMPEVTVIGGSIAPHFERFRAGIEAELTHTNTLAAPVVIRAASLGDDAGAIGAALMVSR